MTSKDLPRMRRTQNQQGCGWGTHYSHLGVSEDDSKGPLVAVCEQLTHEQLPELEQEHIA